MVAVTEYYGSPRVFPRWWNRFDQNDPTVAESLLAQPLPSRELAR